MSSHFRPAGRTLPMPAFGEELDDRSLFVSLVTGGWNSVPLNQLVDSCPKCMGGNCYMVAVMRRVFGGYMFRTCRDCGWCVAAFDSHQRNGEKPE